MSKTEVDSKSKFYLKEETMPTKMLLRILLIIYKSIYFFRIKKKVLRFFFIRNGQCDIIDFLLDNFENSLIFRFKSIYYCLYCNV